MEAAGTVVGAVSLGIVLCDGVIQYCHAWKHQDDEVQTLKDLAGGLKDVLERAEKLLQKPGLDPDLVAITNKNLQVCNDQISKVVTLSNKYTKGKTANNKVKLKDLIRSLKYPFEKTILAELRDVTMTFQHNIKTALGLLDM